MIYEAALENPTTGVKIPAFNPHTVFMICFLSSFLMAVLGSLIFHGSSHALTCFNVRSMFMMLPIAISFAMTEVRFAYIYIYVIVLLIAIAIDIDIDIDIFLIERLDMIQS